MYLLARAAVVRLVLYYYLGTDLPIVGMYLYRQPCPLVMSELHQHDYKS